MAMDVTQVAARHRLAVLGESVTVYPDDGTTRAVTAIVDRQPAEFARQPRGPDTPLHVELLNDAVLGVSGSEWTRTYRIGVARVIGGSAVTLCLVRIVRQSVGLLVFEAR